jgi:hypothetical protein
MMEHLGIFLGNQWNVLPDTHAAWPLEWEKTVIKSIEFGTPFSWVCLRKLQKINKQSKQQIPKYCSGFPIGNKKTSSSANPSVPDKPVCVLCWLAQY